MNKELRIGAIPFYGLCTSLFVIDGIDIYGRVYFPEKLSNFAYHTLPLTNLLSFILPRHFTEHIGDNLSYQLQEPTLSVIFFLLKVAFTLLALLASWGIILPLNFAQISQQFCGSIAANGGVIGTLKSDGPTAFGLFLFCIYWCVEFAKSFEQYRVDFFGKFLEDFGCILFFLTLGLIFTDLIFLLFYFTANKPVKK